MGLLRTALHLFTKRLARRVSQDGLFEKPGERKKSEPLDETEWNSERAVKEEGEGDSG